MPTDEFGPEWEVEDHIDNRTIREKAGSGFLGWQAPLGENAWHLQLEAAGLRGRFGGALGFFRSWQFTGTSGLGRLPRKRGC